MEQDEETNKIANIIADKKLTKTEELSRSVEDIVKKIVDSHCSEVTAIVSIVRNIMKDDKDIISDQEIEDILLQLPVALYEAMEGQEIVGVQLDLSTQIYKEAQSEAYRLARGTISDRNAAADINTRSQQLDKIIYDRAYKMIKGKLDYALETLNSVKKIQASRQQRYESARQDLNRYRNL